MGKLITYKKGDTVGDHGVIFIKGKPPRNHNSGQKTKMGLFRCPRCGREFISSVGSVNFGSTRSCGCLAREIITKRNTKHGLRHTPLYKRWLNIKRRCTNKNHKDFKHYGGRGITLCEEWMNDPAAFIAYCKTLEGWDNAKLTIDRIDNNASYEPHNIRFIPQKEQMYNRRLLRQNKTGYTGVCQRHSYCEAYVTYNNQTIYIGGYKTPREAAIARNEYIESHGFPNIRCIVT